jgi:hypothetical protein
MGEISMQTFAEEHATDQFRTIRLSNQYTDRDLSVGFQVLNTAGIQTRISDNHLVLDFDVVDMRYIETQKGKTDELIANVLEELLKIRSFSSANGKIVFKTFNKAKKVKGKDENRKKRLGFETFQRKFSGKSTLS